MSDGPAGYLLCVVRQLMKQRGHLCFSTPYCMQCKYACVSSQLHCMCKNIPVCLVMCLHCLLQDLHRTGCSSYCGQEAEQDRVVLKRVLLAYARWNKTVGYCQGFNVLAALILEVTEGNEGDALKV